MDKHNSQNIICSKYYIVYQSIIPGAVYRKLNILDEKFQPRGSSAGPITRLICLSTLYVAIVDPSSSTLIVLGVLMISFRFNPRKINFNLAT